MLVLACLTHWYMSLIFFGPIPLVGLAIWINGRREEGRRRNDGERLAERDRSAPA